MTKSVNVNDILLIYVKLRLLRQCSLPGKQDSSRNLFHFDETYELSRTRDGMELINNSNTKSVRSNKQRKGR